MISCGHRYRMLSAYAYCYAKLTRDLSELAGKVATIGRNTAAALGAVFVYLALLESLIRSLRPMLSRFMVGDSAVVLISGNELEVSDGSTVMVLTQGHAYVVLATWVALVVGVGLVMLRARDVN